MKKTVYKIEEYDKESDSWETVAVAANKKLAISYCKSVPMENQENFLIEEVDFYE